MYRVHVAEMLKEHGPVGGAQGQGQAEAGHGEDQYGKHFRVTEFFLTGGSDNRVQGIFSLVTKMFISLVSIVGVVYCGPYLMSHVT